MTPERMAALVARWVRFYTRDLPPPVAERRIDEIDADLHDHIAHERAGGTGDRRIALGIAARMLRGLAADASWRDASPASTRKEVTMSSPLPSASVALVTALVLLVPLVAMQFTDGRGLGRVRLRLRRDPARRDRAPARAGGGGRATSSSRAAAVAIGVAAIVLGEADDAPGLVGFGGLLILGTVALTIRTAQRSA